jgi:hypothetical protein
MKKLIIPVSLLLLITGCSTFTPHPKTYSQARNQCKNLNYRPVIPAMGSLWEAQRKGGAAFYNFHEQANNKGWSYEDCIGSY